MDETPIGIYKKEIADIMQEFATLTSLPIEKDSYGYLFVNYSATGTQETLVRLSNAFLRSAAKPVRALAERTQNTIEAIELELSFLPDGKDLNMRKTKIEARTALGSIVLFSRWASEQLRLQA